MLASAQSRPSTSSPPRERTPPQGLEAGHMDLHPFPHLVTPPLLSREGCARLKASLNDPREWQAAEDGVHSALKHTGDVEALVRDAEGLGLDLIAVTRALAESFGAPLSKEVRCGVLRQFLGHEIRVHNDKPRLGRATHRVLLYLDQPGEDYEGGELNLHDERQLVVARHAPAAGSVVAFEAGPLSFHSVSPITAGRRTTLQIYFYHLGNSPARAARLRRIIEDASSMLSDAQRSRIDACVRDVVRQRADRPDRTEHLAQMLTRAAALMTAFGVDERASLELVQCRAAGRMEAGNDEKELALWWALRLSAQDLGFFSAAGWAQDLEMLERRELPSEPLRVCLQSLYRSVD